MKFKTVSGDRYFRVMHDKQKSLCNKCGSPYHKYRKCPQLICDGCDEQGHTLRECKALRCKTCQSLPMKCFCENDDKTCPYCRTDPCVCYCERCKLAFNDCKCGVDNTDRDLMNEKPEANENDNDNESDINVDKKKESSEHNIDHIDNENVDPVDVSRGGNEQLMIGDNTDGDIEKKVDDNENNTILNINGNTCEEDGNVVNGNVVKSDVGNGNVVNGDELNGDVSKADESDEDIVIQTEAIIHENRESIIECKDIYSKDDEKLDFSIDADSSSGVDVTRTGIGDLDIISPVGASGTDRQDEMIEGLMDVSEGEDELAQASSQKSPMKIRNKTKHFPNVNNAKARVRSSPYDKNVNNGLS
ncbi:unnamed protein product [Mytilus coruscus]|uniref:CCHC-type domain-containing protein n=1 Tax=Mytilus coruscus TaxID=42192 RepID=A0A6J8ESD3_MYTCO|nr:unnamed protein product [Mytilus coruscus]